MHIRYICTAYMALCVLLITQFPDTRRRPFLPFSCPFPNKLEFPYYYGPKLVDVYLAMRYRPFQIGQGRAPRSRTLPPSYFTEPVADSPHT